MQEDNTIFMNYMDQILDRYGSEGDKVFMNYICKIIYLNFQQ